MGLKQIELKLEMKDVRMPWHFAKKLFLIFVTILVTWSLGNAQPESYNHPELKWYTIKTPHFYIHFHNGTEYTAYAIAKIAEDIYGPVTRLYHHEPDSPVHFIVKDTDDYSNGAAYYYENKIEIWATPMDFDLRGTHPWLQNVITHEFTHVVSLQVAMKFTRHVPAAFIQYMHYEKEKRPDVLYGFPDRIVSFPIAGAVFPPWFAEGEAQYQAPHKANDFWDTHRDMVLRTAVLADKMLSYRQMCEFGKTSLGNEMVYDHGFGLVSYIASKYGPDKIHQMTKRMRAPWRISFNSAFEGALGKSDQDVYQEWRAFLTKWYTRAADHIQKHRVAGKLIESKGMANLYPAWSPDGTQVAYVSNKGMDYMSQTSLYLYDVNKKKSRLLKGGVRSSVSWSPDGQFLAYAKNEKVNFAGNHYFDLFLLNVKKKKEKRLTRGLRARNPAFSPDGKKLVFVTGHDGTDNLGIFYLDTKTVVQITHFTDGRQIFLPNWSPDGKQILFDVSTRHGRDLALIDTQGKHFRYLLKSKGDSRSPVFSRDGRFVFFAWDSTGIFNIYKLNVKTHRVKALTNVIGGAFMPSVHPQKGLVFSRFTADGFKIARLSKAAPVQVSPYLAKDKIPRMGPVSPLLRLRPKGRANDGQFVLKAIEKEATPYQDMYTHVGFMPRLFFDYGTTKLGTYFYSSDMLDKYSIFGGVALNRKWDWDVFGMVTYRKFWPTLFLEVYNQIRHTKAVNSEDHYRYNLIEADLGAEFKLNDKNLFRTAFVHSRYNGRLETTVAGQQVKFGYTYLKGNEFRLIWQYRNILPSIGMDANPKSGTEFSLQYDFEDNQFINGFKISSEYGTIVEKYTPYRYNRLQLSLRHYLQLPWHHTTEWRLNGGYIDRPVDSFFNFFAGGLVGLKGYPFYSIEGRKLASATFIYRFPLSQHLNIQFAPLYLDKLYAGLFVDYGNAWNEDKLDWKNFKKDVGFQLRLNTFSFYNYPTVFFFDAAYGLDDVVNRRQAYGREMRYYFGLAFGYMD